jgi:exonuclease SbcD
MARLIHIGDLHLGRQLHGARLLDDQRMALAGLVALIEARAPDALIIAGDVYDRSIPPADAVALLDDFLCKVVAELDVPVIMIAGNHDSADRLAFGSRLFAQGKLSITGPLDAAVQPVVIEDEHGPIEIFPIPFLEPARVREIAQDDTITDQQTAMAEMLRRVAQRRTSARSVLVAHAFVQGGSQSDSERTLSVGGAATISASLFDGFTYVALGHLHRPQHIGSQRIQYAGSLLKYSLSEVGHRKSVTVVDIDGAGEVVVERVSLPLARDLRHLEGTLDELLAGAP